MEPMFASGALTRTTRPDGVSGFALSRPSAQALAYARAKLALVLRIAGETVAYAFANRFEPEVARLTGGQWCAAAAGVARSSRRRREAIIKSSPSLSRGGGPCEAWWRGRADAQKHRAQGAHRHNEQSARPS